MTSAETLFSHVQDLVLWLDLETIVRCFLVCKPWRSDMQTHPKIWTKLMVSRWDIFTCQLRRFGFLEAEMSRATFFRVVGMLDRALRIPIVCDLRYGSVVYSKNKALKYFAQRGYKEKPRDGNNSTSPFAVFEVANQGLWLYSTMKYRRDLFPDTRQDRFVPKDNLVYFDKRSMKVISELNTSLTCGCSRYGNGRTQIRLLIRVFSDFHEHGYEVKKNTQLAIIFQERVVGND